MARIRVLLEAGRHYRGGEGQWSFVLHRVSGLGTLLFLALHILDTSTVYFFPRLYSHAIDLYRTTPFMLGEIGLVFLVLFHGVNGLRLALYDLSPGWWPVESRRPALPWVLAVSIGLWLPAAFLMGRALIVNNFLGG